MLYHWFYFWPTRGVCFYMTICEGWIFDEIYVFETIFLEEFSWSFFGDFEFQLCDNFPEGWWISEMMLLQFGALFFHSIFLDDHHQVYTVFFAEGSFLCNYSFDPGHQLSPWHSCHSRVSQWFFPFQNLLITILFLASSVLREWFLHQYGFKKLKCDG